MVQSYKQTSVAFELLLGLSFVNKAKHFSIIKYIFSLSYLFCCVLKAKVFADNFCFLWWDMLAYADECYQVIMFLWLYVRFVLHSEVLQFWDGGW